MSKWRVRPFTLMPVLTAQILDCYWWHNWNWSLPRVGHSSQHWGSSRSTSQLYYNGRRDVFHGCGSWRNGNTFPRLRFIRRFAFEYIKDNSFPLSDARHFTLLVGLTRRSVLPLVTTIGMHMLSLYLPKLRGRPSSYRTGTIKRAQDYGSPSSCLPLFLSICM